MALATPISPTPSPAHRSSKRSSDRSSSCVVAFSRDNRAANLKTQEPTTPHLYKRRCACFDLYNEVIPYKEAWFWQKSLVQRRHILMERDEDQSDMLIILQHPPVYTLGSASLDKYLKFDINDAPYDVYRTERGGEVTYHGPGQLVLYPIINLRYHKMDLHWYLRSLEEVVIRVLSSTFSIKASRLDGFTGVWVGNQKLAAIGIRVSRWITFHGLALNVTPDLTPFQHIVPCGIQGREVGSISELLAGMSNGATVDDTAIHNSSLQLMDITHESLLKEFSEVFQLSFHHKSISDLDLYIKGE
ncbi:hypothetical protein MRB53_017138 [Persea americana]|uniref:Uncharacterized protein n=1 Tax=Persea americana TaxID=3435 RepID=A0ACC2M4B5_PERAE|nr:hypothetical protein MRB53_017138 [Persea americana]